MHVWMPNVRGNSGSDVFIERLAAGLRKRGVHVTLDWFDARYEFFPDLLAFGRMPHGVDFIHANGLNAYAFRRHGLPLVVTEHHFVMDPAYRPFKTWQQHLYQRIVTGRASRRSFAAASVVVTPSRFTERVLKAETRDVPIAMIPLWVDLDTFTPGSPMEPVDGGERPFRLLFVGNASYRKGADTIVPLLERLGPGYEIACTGGLRGGIDVAGGGAMKHLGRLDTDALVAAYRDCDAVLVPSRYEGFGYAALEGMACGKPVVAFACGAVDEIVVDGETGFLLPTDDLDGTADAIRALRRDTARAAAMGQAGRLRAARCFSEEVGIDSYMALYRDLRGASARRENA